MWHTFYTGFFRWSFLVEITTFRKLAMLSSSGEKRFWNVISCVGCTGLSRYPAIIQHSKLRNFRFYLKKEAEIAVNGCTIFTKNCTIEEVHYICVLIFVTYITLFRHRFLDLNLKNARLCSCRLRLDLLSKYSVFNASWAYTLYVISYTSVCYCSREPKLSRKYFCLWFLLMQYGEAGPGFVGPESCTV
jgi:hypothetical protein